MKIQSNQSQTRQINKQARPNFGQLLLNLPVQKDAEVVKTLSEKLGFALEQKLNPSPNYYTNTKHGSPVERVLTAILKNKQAKGELSSEAKIASVKD